MRTSHEFLFSQYPTADSESYALPKVPATRHLRPPPATRSDVFPARYFFPFFAAGDGNIPPLGNSTILYSPPDAATQRRYSSCGSFEVE